MVGKDEIKRAFSFLKNDRNIKAVLLFGSHAKNSTTARSDVDICIVAPNSEPRDVLRKVWKNLNAANLKYDVYVFEELPLYMKIEIIDSCEVLFSKDVGELYEYFRLYRKIWNDQKHRNELSKRELRKIISSLNKTAKKLHKKTQCLQTKRT